MSSLSDALQVVRSIRTDLDPNSGIEGLTIDSANELLTRWESGAMLSSSDIESLFSYFQHFVDRSVPVSKKSRSDQQMLIPDDLAKMLGSAREFYARYLSLFEWQDGPLLLAMKMGEVFVLDEINLAEDAVIEVLW